MGISLTCEEWLLKLEGVRDSSGVGDDAASGEHDNLPDFLPLESLKECHWAASISSGAIILSYN